MSEFNSEKTSRMRRRTDHKTLESWKAIANYLNRSVRTVRRWETYEGLPVHRHKHTRGASVYAYCSELDEWRGRKRLPKTSENPTNEPSASPGNGRKVILIAAATAGIAIVLAALAFLMSPTQESSQLKNAWILVAEPTTESDVSGVSDNLNAALRREISELDGRHILPQQRIRSSLSLLRKPLTSNLDAALAREVAMRDGNVNALLLPHIEQLGDMLVLSVEIVDPHSGALIAYPIEHAEDFRAAVTAIDDLTEKVGTELTSLPEFAPADPFPAVTTASMTALQLYAQAETMLKEDLPSAAHELLRLAVLDDPKFASALALQSWAALRSGASLDEYLSLTRRASQLTEGVSVDERHFIDGSYRLFSGNLDRAAADFSTLLENDPKNLLATQAMAELCQRRKPAQNCSRPLVRLANLRPGHFDSNLNAAWALAASDTNADRAADLAGRAMELLLANQAGISAKGAARAYMFPVVTAWTKRDLEKTLHELTVLRAELPTMPRETRNQVLHRMIASYLTLGQVGQASDLVEHFNDPATRHEIRAAVMFAAGDKSGMKNHLGAGGNYEDQFTALLLSMAGYPDKALALQESLEADGSNQRQGTVVRAILAMGAGEPATAKEKLFGVVDDLTAQDGAYYFVGPDMLANILKGEGDLVGALSMLETTAPRRIEAAYNNSSLFWMMCQRQLANLYREAGRESEATRIENDLRELLMLADDDFPLAMSLRQEA